MDIISSAHYVHETWATSPSIIFPKRTNKEWVDIFIPLCFTCCTKCCRIVVVVVIIIIVTWYLFFCTTHHITLTHITNILLSCRSCPSLHFRILVVLFFILVISHISHIKKIYARLAFLLSFSIKELHLRIFLKEKNYLLYWDERRTSTLVLIFYYDRVCHSDFDMNITAIIIYHQFFIFMHIFFNVCK